MVGVRSIGGKAASDGRRREITRRRLVLGCSKMTDKELNTLVCRTFKAGLSTEAVAWVFKVPVSVVHKIIREAL